MMDRETGEFEKLHSKDVERLKEMEQEKLPTGEAKWVGPFKVGMVIDMAGGFFRISSIGKKAMVLQALPGTHLYTKGADGKPAPVK